MKVAYQTIIWGPFIYDLEEVLDIIAAAGYQGVEFAQRPDRLGLGDDCTIEALLKQMDKRGLKLVGFAGGTLQERMDFCKQFRPEYLYVEEWDPIIAPKAMNYSPPFTLALHPHYGKKAQDLNEAESILDQHSELQWIPDSAHLILAGQDPVKALDLAPDRLIAVHLKDWSPAYGTSFYRYSCGFTELGRGSGVPLIQILSRLQEANYTGWLVVEQDSTRKDQQTSARECAQWLRNNGIELREQKSAILTDKKLNRDPTNKSEDNAAELRFTQAILKAGSQDIQQCYDDIVKAFMEAIPSHLVTLWMYNSVRDTISLLANEPNLEFVTMSVGELKASGSLPGVAIERHTVTHFNLENLQPGLEYGFPNAKIQWPAIDNMPWKHFVVIPISVSTNPNHVRLTINLFPLTPIEEKLRFKDEKLFHFGMDVAHAADFALVDICSSAAAEVRFFADDKKDSKGFLDDVAYRIQKYIRCEGVSIFLVNISNDRLEIGGTTGIKWYVTKNEEFYRRGEGCTGYVWQTNEPLITRYAPKHPAWKRKSSEAVANPDEDACLIFPFKIKGKVLGVVRCQNKVHDSNNSFSVFTESDVAIIDEICQAAIPHLEILQGEERRWRALSRLNHELFNPLVAIEGALEWIDYEFGDEGIDPTTYFTEDYTGDILSYCQLMKRLVSNANLSGATWESLKIKPSLIYLMREVIAPAVRQISQLLSERNFSEKNIVYGSFTKIPRLWIDKSYFQQVIFNLLSNAVKFAVANPSEFRIEIDGANHGSEYWITIRDWGRGINQEMCESIFDEGIRGPDAYADDVTGQGIGLFIVRRVIHAHGGLVEVTEFKRPTEITIKLPEWLSRHPPRLRS